MKILSYIPISLYIIVNAVYDFYHVQDNTHWAVFYFAGTFFSLLLWTISEAIRDKLFPEFYYCLSLGLAFRTKLELDLWALPYEQYEVSMSNLESDMLLSFWIIALLSIIVVKIWRK